MRLVVTIAISSLSLLLACGNDANVDATDAGGPSDDASTPPPPNPPPPDAGDGGTGGPRCADYDPYKHVYFGDLHTHTAYSADAFGFATRNQPVDAWAFARGKPKQVAADAAIPGPFVTIAHPLDFDAITDHSEWLGVAYACGIDVNGKRFDPADPFGTTCQTYLDQKNGGLTAIQAARQVMTASCGAPKEGAGTCPSVLQTAWQAEQAVANAANVPCNFTALIGYEWTSSDASIGSTLHKNVVFASEHVPDRPFDSADFTAPTDLWSALDAWVAQDPTCKSGAPCAALTIPHNSNKSWGGAFVVPQTASGVDQMQRYQKLVEIHQHKGNSECFYDPDAGATEAACNFEHLTPGADGPSNPKNYVRTALGEGIASYATSRVNPLQLGIVGATDDHNGMPGSVAEDNWHGHAGQADYGPKERLNGGSDKNPGGVTGVWAEENTRPAIFAALSRRETFATSGIFVPVRFYQSWSDTDFCNAGFPKNIVDGGGVPMGGTMNAAGGTSPWFYVSAAKDAADLSRVDIVKGTVNGGVVVESIQTIAAPSPGAFCVRWQDAAFDPKAPSFYYARVFQVPTPRWSHYDCVKQPAMAGCEPGGALDVMIEERAWSSPIWSLP
jgi:hypothetical protein